MFVGETETAPNFLNWLICPLPAPCGPANTAGCARPLTNVFFSVINCRIRGARSAPEDEERRGGER